MAQLRTPGVFTELDIVVMTTLNKVANTSFDYNRLKSLE